MKRCPDCGLEKDESEFGKDSNRLSGLKVYCKVCCRQQYREYHAENPSKATERVRRWRTIPENAQKNRDWASRYYQAHKEERAKYHRQHRAFNPEYVCRERATAKKYAMEHRVQINEWIRCYMKSPRGKQIAMRGRVRRRQHESFVCNDLSMKDIDVLLNIQKNRCAKCCVLFSDAVPYTLDHIIPVSLGGGLTLQNVQLLCRSCNSSKGARTIMYREPLSLSVSV